MGRTRDVPGNVERGSLVGCCCNGSSAFRREGILAGGFLSVVSSADSFVFERLRGLEAGRCLAVRISLPERLPRRPLRRVPRRALPSGARRTRRAMLHARGAERGPPAPVVILSQLEIVPLPMHPHRDVTNPGPRVQPRAEGVQRSVIRGHRERGKSDGSTQESSALVEHIGKLLRRQRYVNVSCSISYNSSVAGWHHNAVDVGMMWWAIGRG